MKNTLNSWRFPRINSNSPSSFLGKANLLRLSAPSVILANTIPRVPASLLSILVPLFNEEEYIAPILSRALVAPLPEGLEREIIVVDDGSTDGSDRIVEEYAARHPGQVRLLRHGRNRGKGAAIRTAVAEARGEYCLIQDADLEYDPHEYQHLLKPLLDGNADAVYGSRFMIVAERRVMYYWHSLANRFVTEFCNLVADLNLTDTVYRLQALPHRGTG